MVERRTHTPQSDLTPHHADINNSRSQLHCGDRLRLLFAIDIANQVFAIMAGNDVARSAPLPQRLYIKETYFQTPKAVVPPSPASNRTTPPAVRIDSTTSSLTPKKDFQVERSAEDTMLFEVADTPAITFPEHTMLEERMCALCRSAWRALQTLFCSLPSSELNDTESSTGRMLRSYRPNSPYGYGSISAGATPTHIPDSAWSRVEWRRRSLDVLAAQPTARGNTVR
ncbi:hypothetical protein M3J09_007241 [Ascochyta lentis]